MYLVQHVGPNKEENVIALGSDPVTLADDTVKIFPQDDGTFKLAAYYKIDLSGEEMSGQTVLKHNMVITCLNGDIYTYRDDKAQVAWRKKLQQVEECAMLEKKYSPKTIELFKNSDYNRFYSDGKYSKRLLSDDGVGLACRFTFFARARYKFERRIFYKIADEKCTAVLAMCPEPNYHTPETIIKEVARKKVPLFFTLGKTQLTSLSMIENNVQFAFCAPLIWQRKIVAVFYADSQHPVHDFSYIGLGHICEKSGKVAKELIDEITVDKLKIIEV